ncbi:MAG TPA: hypothetical protein VME43_24060 [Bryobacteraceae bacterium]|nr:hypothetical protein [Bryobacteraceae bacterium]
MDWSWLDWAAAAVLGGVVGASELISRYKDNPWGAIEGWPAIAYIAINSAASAGALHLIRANGWFGPARWTQILMAGISAMAFFRSSLFVVRAGDRDVGVGPNGFLQIYLAAADRGVDRKRAAARADAVAKAMKGVDYDKAKGVLPQYCLALMQNVPGEDQQSLVQALKDLEGGPAPPSVRVLLLGLELINVVGVDVLTTAVKSLGEQIRSLPEA